MMVKNAFNSNLIGQRVTKEKAQPFMDWEGLMKQYKLMKKV